MNSTQIESLYSAALYLYPENFRLQYAPAMRQTLADALSDANPPRRNFIVVLIRDLATSLLKEHLFMLRETFLRPTLLFNALTLSAIATVLALAIYVIPQQVLRQGADDPQIELAENLAHAIQTGVPIEAAMPVAANFTPHKKMNFFVSSDTNSTLLTNDGQNQPIPPPPTSPNVKSPVLPKHLPKIPNIKGDGHPTVLGVNDAQATIKTPPSSTSLDLDNNVAIIDSDNSIDIAQSLSPFLITYDAQGNPLSSEAKLNGKIPSPPKGVFENVRTKGEERISWQPQPGLRFAAVVIHVPAGKNVKEGFVLAGRSLREVEIREKKLGDLAFINWLMMIGLIVVGTMAFGWITRPKISEAPAV